VSVCVQALPSVHVEPLDFVGFEQTPVPVLHTPATWHWSSGVQVTGFAPMQVPLWQVSVCEQALPSEQVLPLGFAGFVHVPLLGSHVPAT